MITFKEFLEKKAVDIATAPDAPFEKLNWCDGLNDGLKGGHFFGIDVITLATNLGTVRLCKHCLREAQSKYSD